MKTAATPAAGPTKTAGNSAAVLSKEFVTYEDWTAGIAAVEAR